MTNNISLTRTILR